ncbi:peptidase inhibitor family I36 protein [Streptomyces sp. NBC_01102]|uniref:peptidase inhibitor family I36 protein n=1 Tax=Streptomyces sp. NBC_01102 TaxID=2903749 RepID=UPI003866980F|nr:peptidase inhibitor family I36 protein [Streptomyces sp. NBC_01102]
MSWIARTAAATSVLTLVAGGVLAGATPAAAVGGCASGYLCIYDGWDFTGNKIVSASTNACFRPKGVSSNFTYTRSYVNNLPVDAALWGNDGSGSDQQAKIRSLPSGGFSSAIPVVYEVSVCMGGAKPA